MSKKINYYRYLCFIMIALVSGACATTAYVGDRYAPTESVEVFYSAKDVKQEYRVIGHLSEKLLGQNDEWARQRIIAKGKDVGADAVIILGFDYAGSEDPDRYLKAEAIKYTD